MIKVCKKCGTKFEVTKGLVNYCSLKCRNSRGERSEEVKEKIRNGVLKSELFLTHIINYKPSELTKNKISDGRRRYEDIKIFNNKNWTCTKCLKCNNDIYHLKSKTRKYHLDCWRQCSGGLREGSVTKYKSGRYKGYWCDSSWELAWVIYHIDHEIKFERNKIGFEYIFEGKKRKYYPDFIKDEIFYEIKGNQKELDLIKFKQFPKKLIILYKKDIQLYIDYVITKYGKDYINLYEIRASA